jgi:hypothetical protein
VFGGRSLSRAKGTDRLSYDISLFDKSFLRRALIERLGDWTNADPIPQEASASLVEAALKAGFMVTPPDPEFVAFVREQGVEPAPEYTLDSEHYLAQLAVHRGQLAFTIPYSDRTDASIRLCTELAKGVATEFGLAFWDPQDDEHELA